MANVASPLYRLADTLLDGDFAKIVTQHRRAGSSWRFIAQQLRDRTGTKLDVTPETLRQWFREAGDA